MEARYLGFATFAISLLLCSGLIPHLPASPNIFDRYDVNVVAIAIFWLAWIAFRDFFIPKQFERASSL